MDNLEKTGSMLNKMVFTLPKIDSENKEKDDLKARNMKAVFLDKIAQVLKTGNVVNLLKTSGGGGHYTTITGIKGDQIEYLDSYHSDSYNVIQSDPIDTIFNRVYGTSNQIEIEFITKMKSPQEMTLEFTDLNYSEKDGYTLRQISEENVFNVGQTKGLAVKKNFNDLGRGMDGISHAVYFANPKQKVETERIENHEWLPEEDQTVKLPKKVAKSEFPKIVDYGLAAIKKDRGRAGGAKTDEEKKPTAKQIEEYNDFQNMLSQKQKVDERRRKKDEATKDLRQKLRTELSEDKKKGKEAIKEYEKKSGDYSSFGVSFDLRDVNINIGDSKYMRRVKSALKQYIYIRKERILELPLIIWQRQLMSILITEVPYFRPKGEKSAWLRSKK